METFDEWFTRNATEIAAPGQLQYNAVGWMRKAYESAKAQSRNYVADEEVMPERITFANGRVVTIEDNPNPNVGNGVYLAVGQLPD